MKMGQYIPDLTERFPEGFGGVDMTPSYFGGTVDWSRAYKEDDYYDDFRDEYYGKPPTEPRKFEIGNEYEHVGNFGGVTIFKVEEIDRENKKILLSEVWIDVDGEGTRPAEWHKLEEDDKGNEKAFYYYSKLLETEVWICA